MENEFEYLEKRLNILEKGFRDLNLRFTKFEAQVGTVVALVKWLITPSVCFGFLIQLYRVMNGG